MQVTLSQCTGYAHSPHHSVQLRVWGDAQLVKCLLFKHRTWVLFLCWMQQCMLVIPCRGRGRRVQRFAILAKLMSSYFSERPCLTINLWPLHVYTPRRIEVGVQMVWFLLYRLWNWGSQPKSKGTYLGFKLKFSGLISKILFKCYFFAIFSKWYLRDLVDKTHDHLFTID